MYTYNTFIGNAEDLDIVMPMYNLLEYSAIILRNQEDYGIFIEMKSMMMLMKIMLIIIRKTTTRQEQVNLLSIRQK